MYCVLRQTKSVSAGGVFLWVLVFKYRTASKALEVFGREIGRGRMARIMTLDGKILASNESNPPDSAIWL